MGTSTAPFQIIAGPADVWVAPTTTAFPALNAAPAGAFYALGKTSGGIQVQHSQTVNAFSADQTTGDLKAVRSKEGLEITFSLMETTIDTYAKALNSATVTTVGGSPGDKEFNPHRGRNVAQYALLIRGDSPYGVNWWLQYEVPIVYFDDQPAVDFKEDGFVVLKCTFKALEDLSAGSEAARFGTIRGQNAT